VKEEPLVPFGMALTVAALLGAGKALKSNDHKRANIMFRRRVYAQGFTLLCICVGGMYWGRDREKRKEYEQLEKDKVNVVKRDRWLAELEARDVEDKAAKERVVRLKEKRKQREDQIRAKIKAEESSSSDTESVKPPDPEDSLETKAEGLVDKASKLWKSQK
jgi:hypothetical protein